MAEAAKAQQRVQKAVTGMVDELDNMHLRKLQANMHRCSADCCDSNQHSLEQVHQCMINCSKDVTAAQKYVQEELNRYQGRLQSCAKQCQDQGKDRILPSSTEDDIAKLQRDYEQCVVKCADSHVELIPSMHKRMSEVLKSKKY